MEVPNHLLGHLLIDDEIEVTVFRGDREGAYSRVLADRPAICSFREHGFGLSGRSFLTRFSSRWIQENPRLVDIEGKR